MNTSKPKYNILAVKTVGERNHYTRIGVAFPLEKDGFNILLDALPTAASCRLRAGCSVGTED